MRRISPALVLSVVALVLAVGGTAVAGSYIITSTHQIKPSVRRALKGNRGPQGPQGPQGVQGAQGAPGQFSTSNVTIVRGPVATMCGDTGSFQTCQVGSSVATCPAGSVVLGGGFDGLSNPPVVATIGYDYALSAGSWEVIQSNEASIDATFQAVAECATGTPTTRAVSRSAVQDRAAHDLANVIAAHR